MAIADLMSRNVATCMVGMLTDRDVCMATHTQGKAPQHILVREAMAREVYSCLPDDNLAEAEGRGASAIPYALSRGRKAFANPGRTAGARLAAASATTFLRGENPWPRS